MPHNSARSRRFQLIFSVEEEELIGKSKFLIEILFCVIQIQDVLDGSVMKSAEETLTHPYLGMQWAQFMS